MTKIHINTDWKEFLKPYLETQSFLDLENFIDIQYSQHTIYPLKEKIFNALSMLSLDKIRVVIIGQDPYYNPGQAHGLAFSVSDGITPPPSLKNIYKEIQSDIGTEKNLTKGDLTSWAQQGVLLLNSVLTVEKNKPGSHAKHGWEEFTDYIIKKLSNERKHLVFILWGNYAQQKGKHIDQSKHLVLQSAHPSPLSAYRGFFGNRHFSQTNAYLKINNHKEIKW